MVRESAELDEQTEAIDRLSAECTIVQVIEYIPERQQTHGIIA